MAGTVTNPTGSVKGKSLTGLCDAYTGTWSGSGGTYSGTTGPVPPNIAAQSQHWVLMSATTGVCARAAGGGYAFAANEVTLRAIMVSTIGYPNSLTTIPPAGDLPLTFDATGTFIQTSDGVLRQANCKFMQAKSNGSAGTDISPTSGTITFTRMDATVYEGSYDMWFFGTDHVTGSFVAPWC